MLMPNSRLDKGLFCFFIFMQQASVESNIPFVLLKKFLTYLSRISEREINKHLNKFIFIENLSTLLRTEYGRMSTSNSSILKKIYFSRGPNI
jgi:hypothetical protein